MIAAVAIIVIGPKEIPRTLGTIGRWLGKARSLAREFQSNVDDMITQSEIAELKKTANPIGEFNAENILEDTTSTKINENEPRYPGLSKEQRDGEDGTRVLDNEIGHYNDQLTQLEAEKNSGSQHDEINEIQVGPTDKKIAAKATES